MTVEKERYKLCQACGNFAGFEESALYCVVCGSRFIDECPNCREPIIYPLARFCPACGSPLLNPKTGDVTP